MFLKIFLVVSSHCWFHWLDLSHLGGWVDRRRCPPRPRARIGLAGLGPKVVSLAGHHDVFLCRLKQRDTVKVTVGNRLKRHWIQHTIVDAGRRLFGAIIYLHALHENRARHVYGVTSSLPSFSFFSSSLEISIHPYSS